jgi:hypothetical protein
VREDDEGGSVLRSFLPPKKEKSRTRVPSTVMENDKKSCLIWTGRGPRSAPALIL